jgi:hypothetical protein
MTEIVEFWARWKGYYKYRDQTPFPNVPYPWRIDFDSSNFTLKSNTEIIEQFNQYMIDL